MSVEALSLARNVMTVIDFSHKIYESYQKIRSRGTLDQGAQRLSDDLERLASDLKKSRTDLPASPPADNSQLINIADQCAEAAGALREEYQTLVIPQGASGLRKHWKSVKIVAKYKWRHDEIEQLKATLDGCQQTMQTAVLVRMYNKGEAQSMRRRQDFDSLDTRLKNFIDAVSKQQLKIQELFAENRMLHQETREVILERIAAQQRARVSEAEASRFVESLKYPGLNERYHHVKEAHHQSCHWLLGSSQISDPSASTNSESVPQYLEHRHKSSFRDFAGWLEEDAGSELYWISGKPGAGKSTLMKFLFKQMEQNDGLGHRHKLVFQHFFWLGQTNTRSRQNDLEGLLSSILHQALTLNTESDQSIISSLWQELPRLRRKSASTDWGLDELRKATQAVLKRVGSSRPVYLLIDALDEHLPTSDHDELMRTIKSFRTISGVRVVVSSRRELAFERHLGHARQLRVENLNALDIYRYAVGDLGTCTRPGDIDHGSSISQTSPLLLEDLVRMIVEKSDCVFLWARLAVESVKRGIQHGNTDGEIKSCLKAMPNDLKEYFKSMWKRLGDDEKRYKTQAANIFSLLLSPVSATRILIHAPVKELFAGIDTLTLGFALSLDDAVGVIHGKRGSEEGYFHNLCHQYQRMVVTRCAGLVEVKDAPWSAVDECTGASGAGALAPIATCDFIHRTARDFLREEVEGKEILAAADLGQQGPKYRLLVAYLARSVAFRATRHVPRLCNMIATLDAAVWLDSASQPRDCPDTTMSEQRHQLLTLGSTIFDYHCRRIESPGSAWYQDMRRVPFMTWAAYYGNFDYVASWVAERLHCQPPLSPPTCSMVWKAAVLDQTLVRPVEGHPRFAHPLFRLLRSTGADLNAPLPLSCIHVDLKQYNSGTLFPHAMVSTSHILLHAASEFYHLHDDHGHDAIIPSLIFAFINSKACLQAKIAAVFEVGTDSEDDYKGPTLSFLESSYPPDQTRILLEITPLCAWDWIAKLGAGTQQADALGGTTKNSIQAIGDYVRSEVGGGQRLQAPRLISIFPTPYSSSFSDASSLSTEPPLDEGGDNLFRAHTVPDSLAESFMESLTAVVEATSAQRDDRLDDLRARIDEVRHDPSSKRLEGEPLEEELVPCGFLCTYEEQNRYEEACMIRLPPELCDDSGAPAETTTPPWLWDPFGYVCKRDPNLVQPEV